MITAREARRNVMAYCNDHIDCELAVLSERIEEASKKGTSSMSLYGYFYDPKMLKMIIKACKRKGYSVTKAGLSFTISWE